MICSRRNLSNNRGHRHFNMGELEDRESVRLPVEHEELRGKHASYYQVSILNLYPSEVTKKNKHNQLSKEFAPENIEAAIFAQYADRIFERRVKFIIDAKVLRPEDFVIGPVENHSEQFTSLDGTVYPMDHQFMLVKATDGKHRVFLRSENAGIKTVGYSFDYSVDIPEEHRWFYSLTPHSSTKIPMPSGTCLCASSPHSKHLHEKVKATLDAFFANRYADYMGFLKNLKADTYYPYREKQQISSTSRDTVFNQIAYPGREPIPSVSTTKRTTKASLYASGPLAQPGRL